MLSFFTYNKPSCPPYLRTVTSLFFFSFTSFIEENKEGSSTDTDLERLTLPDLAEAMGSTVGNVCLKVMVREEPWTSLGHGEQSEKKPHCVNELST